MSDKDDLYFDAARFLGASPLERARLCRALARSAQQLAEKTEPPVRDSYVKIAKQWGDLAHELEKQG